MAIGFVNAAFSTGSTTAGTTKTISLSVTAGNTIIVSGFGVGVVVSNVTDNAGNTYSPVVGPNTNTVTSTVWSTNPNAALTTATITITVHFASSTRNTCVAAQYSGVTGIGLAGQASGSSTTPSVSITTQNANNWVVAFVSTEGTSTYASATGNLRSSQAGAGSTTPGGGVVDNTSVSPASTTCSATITSGAWVANAIELTTVSAPEDADDDVGGWAGVNLSGGTPVAIAAALATSIILGFAQQGTISKLATDEDYWQNPTAPVAATLYQPLPYFYDAGEWILYVAPGEPDEDLWQNPTPPVPATLYQRLPYLPDPEEIPAASLFGVPEELYWQNPTPPVAASLFQNLPFRDPEEISAGTLHGQYDEDFWANPTPPVPASLLWPQQFSFDVQEPAGKLFGQPDEDFWINPVAPVPATLYQQLPLGDPEEIPAGNLYGVPNEDYWLNLTGYAAPPNLQPTIVDSEYAPPALSVDGDPYQPSILQPTWLAFPQPIDTEFAPPPAVTIVDEDYWQQSTPTSAGWIIYLPPTEAEVSFPVATIVDEDYQLSLSAPTIAWTVYLPPPDSDLASPAAITADDYWQQPFFTFTNNIVPSLWIDPDPILTAPVSAPANEDYWLNLNSLNSNLNYLRPLDQGSDEVIRGATSVVIWINS